LITDRTNKEQDTYERGGGLLYHQKNVTTGLDVEIRSDDPCIIDDDDEMIEEEIKVD